MKFSCDKYVLQQAAASAARAAAAKSPIPTLEGLLIEAGASVRKSSSITLTWGEAPSWGMDANDPEVARNFMTEWSEEIVRDRNHPSIVTWTPMNEEWWPDRVQFPRFVSDVYDLTKMLDPTRPVCDVSGGVHIKTDIWTTHNYEQDPKKLKDIIFNGER